jgi:hypothetical protein
MEVRAINLFYGTHYDPADLEDWHDCDIQEAIQIAVRLSLSDGDNTTGNPDPQG